MDQFNSCVRNPNFPIIYSFIQKFSSLLSIPSYTIKQLEDNIINTSEELCQLQQFLLKKLNKSMRAEFWQKNLVKFSDNMSEDEREYLHQKAYNKISIASKLIILKNLLESQFDGNNDIKNEILNDEGDTLRDLPIGCDNLGSFYWFQQDTEGTISLYREDSQNQNWELLCHEREGLISIIESLQTSSENFVGTDHPMKIKNPPTEQHNVPTREDYVQPSSQQIKIEASTEQNIDALHSKLSGADAKYSSNNKELLVKCNGDPFLENSNTVTTPTHDLPNVDNVIKDEFKEDRRRFLRQSIRNLATKQHDVTQSPKPKEGIKGRKFKTYNRCHKCGKMKPSATLTCHVCKNFYHPTCTPESYLIYDEETEWLCPICQHEKLTRALTEKLAWLDAFNESKRQMVRKKERLAVAGINIANILDYTEETLNLKFGNAPRPADTSKISTLTGIRSCRIKKHINYQFDEYDKLMDKAIKEQNNANPKGTREPLTHLKEIPDEPEVPDTSVNDSLSQRLADPDDATDQNRPHVPAATFESYVKSGGSIAPRPTRTNRSAQVASSSLPTNLVAVADIDARPRRAKKRPDRFDEQTDVEERRYGDSSDSSEFEYGYKPRKSFRRSHNLDTTVKPTNLQDSYGSYAQASGLDLWTEFEDGYFKSGNRKGAKVRTARVGKESDRIRNDPAPRPFPSTPTPHKPGLAPPPGPRTIPSTPEPCRPCPTGPALGQQAPALAPLPMGLHVTRLVSDETEAALTPVSYYTPPPALKTSPQADTHPLLNLCHMTSLYPNGSTTVLTKALIPINPSPLGHHLQPAGPGRNCILLPVVNSNGLIVHQPVQQQPRTPPNHHTVNRAGLAPDPGLTVIDVNSLLNNVIPKTSLW